MSPDLQGKPDHELTDDEILSDPDLSRTLWEAMQAFAEDPLFMAEMSEYANKLDRYRERGQRLREKNAARRAAWDDHS